MNIWSNFLISPKLAFFNFKFLKTKKHGKFPDRFGILCSRGIGDEPESKVEDMEPEHIENTKLKQVVAEEAVLSPTEIEHLKDCEECLELIRVLVRNRLVSR